MRQVVVFSHLNSSDPFAVRETPNAATATDSPTSRDLSNPMCVTTMNRTASRITIAQP